jgi:hypothetical protein
MVVVGIRQGAGVALTAIQVWVRMDFYWVALGFQGHVWQKERAEL